MLSSTPIAISPGSATLFFVPSIGVSSQKTFSKGCAVNLNRYITASIKPYPFNRIYLNGILTNIEPVQRVVKILAPEPVSLYLESELPLAAGFGVSAACSLASSFAIARRYDLDMTRLELGLIAHQAEVECRTGLGDVAAQLCGGVVLRKCTEGPLHCVKIKTSDNTIYYKNLGRLRTSSILESKELMPIIIQEGQKIYSWLQKNLNTVNLEQILEKSLCFAKACKFVEDPDINVTIKNIYKIGGGATVIMLGKSILATKVPSISDWENCKVDNIGTRWI